GGQYARGTTREQIQIEADEGLTHANLLALPHMQLKPFAAKGHGVDSDMEQYLRPGVSPQRNCMSGGWNSNQLALTGSVQGRIGRIDRQAIAEHAPGEDAIRCLVEGGAPTCQRCN